MKEINVKDFGAVADGVTDDSQAFRDAYAAATDGPATITHPPGVYLISLEQE